MKICLIGPPIVAEFEGNAASRADIVRRSIEAPTGILNLAALLEKMGTDVQILDVNHLFCEVGNAIGPESNGIFFARAEEEIRSIEADVFGFGTLSGSYPLTVRLASAAKNAHPASLVVFGGPQASALDVETLDAFPFVDLIVRGEAEETFPRLLAELNRPESQAGIMGITCRINGRVVRAANAPVVENLDGLPTAAYHLWQGIDKSRSVALEVGRGCPFSCTFCSTSPYFRRQYRLKSPNRLIDQMRSIRQAYGIEEFNLIHDAFTTHRGKVIEFCEALLKSGEKFRWACSARTDCVDEELLRLMAKAGCVGIFFGVETGSPRIQQAIGKMLDLDQALAAIRYTEDCRMGGTVSLITGFPDESPEELQATVRFFIDSLRFEKVVGQLHLLAPLAGSALHAQHRENLQWEGCTSELSLFSWQQDSADYDLILKYPQIFPEFYAFRSRYLDRSRLMEFRNFALYGAARFRWLIIALHQHSGNLVEVFERWRLWLAQNRLQMQVTGDYCYSAAFRSDFLEFVSTAYPVDGDAEALAVATLLEYEMGLEKLKDHKAPAPSDRPSCSCEPFENMKAVPQLAPGVALLRLSADYQSVIECMKSRRSPKEVPRRPTVVADRLTSDGSVQVIQLSALSAVMVALCDGTRTVMDISRLFPNLEDGLDGYPQEEACIFALNELVRQGLLAQACQREGPQRDGCG
jgi:hypothetical protein